MNVFFLAKLSSSNVKTVAFTKAPENEGEKQDIRLVTTFILSLAGHIDMFFFPVFLFVIFGFCLFFG